jgi:hypothetical protein
LKHENIGFKGQIEEFGVSETKEPFGYNSNGVLKTQTIQVLSSRDVH